MKMLTSLFVLAALGMTLTPVGPAFAGNQSQQLMGQGFGQGFGYNSGRSRLPALGSQNGRMSLMQVAAGPVPLAQVLDNINAQEPGRQLDTTTEVENGRTIYVVRWQASRGRIIIFRVDAETGQIIGRQG
jgi:hypothetical protein